MSISCKVVEESIACGEKLGASASDHIASCESCETMHTISLSLSSSLGASAKTPMPLGLAPRLQASVGRRLEEDPSHRGRFIALGIGSVLAAAALLLVLRTGGPDSNTVRSSATASEPSGDEPATEASDTAPATAPAIAQSSPEVEDLLQVVLLADIEQSLNTSADWDLYLEPLAATELLAREVGR